MALEGENNYAPFMTMRGICFVGEERLSDQLSVHASYPLNSYLSQIGNDVIVYSFILLPILYLYYSDFDKSFIGPYFLLLSIAVLLPLSLFLLRNIYNLIHWLISPGKNQNKTEITSIYFVSKNEIIQPVQFIQFISSNGEKIELERLSDSKLIELRKEDFYQKVEFEPILLDLDRTHQIQYDETILEFHLHNITKYMAKNKKTYIRLIVELQSEKYINPDPVQSHRVFLETKFQERYHQNPNDYVPVTWKDYKSVYQIFIIAFMFLVIFPAFNIPPGFAGIISLVIRLIISSFPLILIILSYVLEKRKESLVQEIRDTV